jgi:hypothetical protein
MGRMGTVTDIAMNRLQREPDRQSAYSIGAPI